MRKRIISIVLLITLFISNTAFADFQKYRYEFFNTFDTLISIIAYSDDKAVFDNEMQNVKDVFTSYHELFDIYNEYDGINNLATVNKLAYKEPVKVSDKLFEFLLYAKNLQKSINSPANIAFGRVLRLWHNARTVAEADPSKAYLPSMDELKKASEHCDINNLILDESNSTVSFTDDIQIDVGALAKGYACEKAAQYLLNSAIPNFIINAGGNIRAGLAPLDKREYWGVGIADPFKVYNGGSDIFDIVFVKETSIVTSGDYERLFTYDGNRYHHIIDPKTLYPSNHFRSVSIYTEDSTLADYLSTALFCLPYDKGFELVSGMDGVEAMWILDDGSFVSTDGFKEVQKSQGASSMTLRD